MLRSFPTPAEKKGDKTEWPMLKWSHDESYVAKMTSGEQGIIYVYETPSMGLMGKKSIKVENLMEFSWSPTDNRIAYWTPEKDNVPARVTLIDIPSRNIVRTKNFFGVLGVLLIEFLKLVQTLLATFWRLSIGQGRPNQDKSNYYYFFRSIQNA
jgi:uncharacterized protein with WD repeat